jgi:hypothetical protein
MGYVGGRQRHRIDEEDDGSVYIDITGSEERSPTSKQVRRVRVFIYVVKHLGELAACDEELELVGSPSLER